MSELAQKLIEENIAKHERGEDASYLDLGNCGLRELPEELGQCEWLEVLVLSNNWIELNKDSLNWDRQNSQNNGEDNQLQNLKGLEHLRQLRKLILNRSFQNSKGLQNLSPLAELESLRSLDFSNTQISDLRPLSTLQNLEALSFWNTQVKDLEPLSRLINLRELYFWSTPTQDLFPLAKLQSLQVLNCGHSKVIDLAPLECLQNLQNLSCEHTEIENLSPLSHLQGLKLLTCSNTKVEDLSPLRVLKHLNFLDFWDTNVKDLSPISDLVNLNTLNCSETYVKDLSPLSNLKSLRSLHFVNTSVQDLSPLENLQYLQSLSCAGTQVLDLTPLVKLRNLQSLNCSFTQVQDLSPLTNLNKLQEIDISKTSVENLNTLTSMKNLQSLYCSKTQIQSLSPLTNIQNLQKLDCSHTEVHNLKPLESLNKLEKIICSNTQIYELKPLIHNRNLQTLDCSHTLVSDLTSLAKLDKLQRLDLSYTNVQNLKPLANLVSLDNLNCNQTLVEDLGPLTNLHNIKSLSCWGSQVNDLGPLANLKNLLSLNFARTGVSNISPLASLKNLRSLNCESTPIDDLSPLASLNNLRSVGLSETKIQDISPLLPLIEKGVLITIERIKRGINLYNTPLIIPPIEFVQAGNEAILEYFDQLGDNRDPLNELKIIFIGEGAAGKTSLIKQVRTEAFDPQESQTHGIRIKLTPFTVDGDTVQAHVWDFGGQEVMHATHQFFLSRRCVYVLVLNSRTDEKAEYWLKHASSFGGDSPILVVLNKMDENPSYEVERKQLLEKYPQIVDFFKVSCQTGAGIAEFKEALLQQIAISDTRRTPFPKSWAAVKAHFADMNADYINEAEYRVVCETHGVTRTLSQGVLLEFLHDLGVIINFKDLRHFDTQILNPLWLTNGVYRVINSPIVAEQLGIMREDELARIINDPRYTPDSHQERRFNYPADKLNYIARVMEAFELCFHLDADTYVVPQLLSVAEPEFEMEGSALNFLLLFPEFLPDSIFPRLMVKLHPYISGNLRWRTGMVLSKPSIFDAQARIRVDKEDRKIKIDVCGAEPRRLLSFIRETVREIVDGFAHLNYDELVPVPDTKEVMEYDYLLEAEKAGVEMVFIRGKGNVSIKDLLNGVEEATMREDTAQIPVRVFVSYSHKDDAHRQNLRTALAPLIRLHKLQVWDDRDIAAGNEWKEQIFRELAAADIVLCLISADFIDSDFCYSQELAQAMEAHRRGKQVVIPVRTRKCAWEDLPIAQIQGVPTSGWLASTPNPDEALTQVVKSLTPLVAQIKDKKLEQRKIL